MPLWPWSFGPAPLALPLWSCPFGLVPLWSCPIIPMPLWPCPFISAPLVLMPLWPCPFSNAPLNLHPSLVFGRSENGGAKTGEQKLLNFGEIMAERKRRSENGGAKMVGEILTSTEWNRNLNLLFVCQEFLLLMLLYLFVLQTKINVFRFIHSSCTKCELARYVLRYTTTSVDIRVYQIQRFQDNKIFFQIM